jgi:AcrR family transcriptional regulator
MSAAPENLRADARRNRARVLEAAEAILLRDGLSASMRAIARHAGVGLATIYRQFPTKEALYQAILVDRLRRLVDQAESLSAAPDPGAAFFEFFANVVENSTGQKLFVEALSDAGIDVKTGTSGIRRDIRHAIHTLLINAQQAGAVRADVEMPELLALLAATSMAAERNHWSPELRARALAVVFDGLGPPNVSGH